jgi:hypothetical protein
MDQDRNQEPGKRLRSILSSHDGDADAHPQSQDQPETRSPLLQLPKRKPFAQAALSPDAQNVAPQASAKASPPAQPAPSHAKEAVVPQRSMQVPPPEPPQRASSSRGLRFGPPFWTITGILSLVVNAMLIAVLLVLYDRLGQLQSLQGTASNIGASVLGGMYSNFEKMDRATIRTVIPVDAQIPLDITVPVQTTTLITLAESVNIPNAQVVINTGGLNINSNARVTLPAGTPLTVNLNFDLPVQATIPVHLEVPVIIPMAETELHEPFVGLQEVVRPWYCMVEPNAFSLYGQSICR